MSATSRKRPRNENNDYHHHDQDQPQQKRACPEEKSEWIRSSVACRCGSAEQQSPWTRCFQCNNLWHVSCAEHVPQHKHDKQDGKDEPDVYHEQWICSTCRHKSDIAEVIHIDADKETSSDHSASESTDVKQSTPWVTIGEFSMDQDYRTDLLDPTWKLDDTAISAATSLLRGQSQARQIDGWQLTLMKNTTDGFRTIHNESIQLIHHGRDHWACVTTLDYEQHGIRFYDSLCEDILPDTHKQLAQLFIKPVNQNKCDYNPAICKPFGPIYYGPLIIRFIRAQQQEDAVDCGLFAIANATALIYGVDPRSVKFDQLRMREHLVQCFENGRMEMFPTI